MADTSRDEQKIDDLLARGIENVISSPDELKKRLLSGDSLNCYLGIDPTATRIHLGHAFNLRKLQAMAELGHHVYFLIGSFTALVGDTSDKNDERPVLTREEIDANMAQFKELAAKFLDFDKVTVVYNHEWLSELSFADVVDLTRHFSVNDFTSRELIRDRLDQGKRVGLLETLYPLMQGYDSYHLDTDIQFGATDQTFNMQAGRTLQKRLRGKESFVVASGYLPGTDGRKMSKSWGNAIWLDDAPNDVYGKVMSISDDVIADYFWLGTDLPKEAVEEQLARLDNENPMEVKKTLAAQITRELCGEDAVEAAAEHFTQTVQQKSAEDEVVITAQDMNLNLNINDTALVIDTNAIIDQLVTKGLVQSKSQARRLFEQGAVHRDDKKLSLEDTLDLSQGPATLRIGKRRYITFKK